MLQQHNACRHPDLAAKVDEPTAQEVAIDLAVTQAVIPFVFPVAVFPPGGAAADGASPSVNGSPRTTLAAPRRAMSNAFWYAVSGISAVASALRTRTAASTTPGRCSIQESRNLDMAYPGLRGRQTHTHAQQDSVGALS